jgi:hypothetical protein
MPGQPFGPIPIRSCPCAPKLNGAKDHLEMALGGDLGEVGFGGSGGTGHHNYSFSE